MLEERQNFVIKLTTAQTFTIDIQIPHKIDPMEQWVLLIQLVQLQN